MAARQHLQVVEGDLLMTIKATTHRQNHNSTLDHHDDVEETEHHLSAVDPRAPAHDPFEFRKLSRRVCLIRRDQGSEATGFLVGPDLMLTAAHALMGTSGIFADPEEVTILFDQFIWNKKTRRMAAGDQCKLRHIPFTRQPDVVASSIRIDAMSRRRLDDNGMDYVLVRLDRPIGLSFLPFSYRLRGWTNCSIAKKPALGPVFVVQHPLGGLQQFAGGIIRSNEPVPDLPFHFRYKTDAFIGTSGSPMVSIDREVLGMHVGERLDDHGKTAHQLGVSLQDIHADLASQGVHLPKFSADLPPEVMESMFGWSETEQKRKQGFDWRGDRLFDDPSRPSNRTQTGRKARAS
jgi:hypothetical protein